MNKNYSSIVLNILSPFRENLINNVAILCQSRIKKSGSKMLAVFLLFLAMTSGQKLLAKNTPNRFFNTNLSIKNDLLASSVAEGRGGGGGHGNYDWVGWLH